MSRRLVAVVAVAHPGGAEIHLQRLLAGLRTVLAEAMTVGTPVVATRVDGLSEVLSDGITGRLVAPGDPQGLAAAVLEVLSRNNEMGAAARRQAQRFSAEEYVQRVERLIAP